MIDFSDLRLEVVEESEDKGVYKVGPLPRGYGHTLANSIRRVLLSSLEGSAVTSIRIAGVDHEYSTIEGVKETIIQVELNVKAIRFKCESSDPQVVRLSSKGEGEVTAGDLELTESVEVMNPEATILTITDDDTSVEMELVVERGVGYFKADEELRAEAGRLPLDADFGPIERVMFSVDETRKGEKTNLDMVTLTIFTDGSIMPGEAFQLASKKLLEAFDRLEILISTGGEEPEEEKAEEETSEDVEETDRDETDKDEAEETDEELKDLKIEDLPISTRTKTALMEAGMETLEDVLDNNADELLDVSGFGQKSLEEVQDLIDGYGMSLKE